MFIIKAVSYWAMPVKFDVEGIMSKRSTIIKYSAGNGSTSIALHNDSMDSIEMTDFAQRMSRIGYIFHSKSEDVVKRQVLNFVHSKHGDLDITIYKTPSRRDLELLLQ